MHGSSPYSKPGVLSPFPLLPLVLCKELREEATLERQHLVRRPGFLDTRAPGWGGMRSESWEKWRGGIPKGHWLPFRGCDTERWFAGDTGPVGSGGEARWPYFSRLSRLNL